MLYSLYTGGPVIVAMYTCVHIKSVDLWLTGEAKVLSLSSASDRKWYSLKGIL